jgi:hypothetical protein
MITIFEGIRNSGKTFLSHKFSHSKKLPIYKFDFVGWFTRLELGDSDESTHLFALGKELMLLQLNSQGFLPSFVLDRGILTVLTWGVLSGRITLEKASEQLEKIAKSGILTNCEIIVVSGQNPSKDSRNKDVWDFRDGDKGELEILEYFINRISSEEYGIKVTMVENTFDERTLTILENI